MRLRRLVLALLGVVALLVAAPNARAADSPCAPEVAAWVARAALDTRLAMRAASCWEHGARVELDPDGGEPLAVEIADGPGDAFRRVGALRLAPILEIDDFARVDARRRDAFERLAAWIASHEGDVRLGASATGPSPSRAPWLLLAAVLLVVASRFGQPKNANDRFAALALFVGALALRLLLGAWGPLHVNGKGPLWIAAAATDGAEVSFYGPGYPEIFGPITRLASSLDVALFAQNGVVSALVAPLAFALARTLGLSLPRAAFAAALLAIDPVAVRGATTEGYFAVILALALGASIAAVNATSAWADRDRARGAAWALASALVCAQAVRIHPAAWGPAALAPLAAVAIARAMPVARRLALAVAVYGVVAGVVFVADGRIVAAVLAHLVAGALHAPTYSAARLAWALPLLGAAVVARPKQPWLVVPAMASVVALLLTRDTYLQSALWQGSFDRLYVAVPIIAAVAIAADALGRRARILAMAAALATVAAWAPAALHARTTEQLEYRWLRGELAAIPRGCRVLHVSRVDKRELYLPTYAARALAPSDFVDVEAPSVDDVPARANAGCAYYVHASLCTSREGAPVCDAAERRLVFGAADRATFPALPSSRELPYDAGDVQVWIARVDGVKP